MTRIHKSSNSRSLPSASRRDSLFWLAAVTIFLTAASSRLFTSPSLESEIKTREDFNSIIQWDEPQPTLYEQLGIDAYSHQNINTSGHHKIYKYISPYEQRFPNYKRPYWAEKTIPYNNNVPTNKQICFVHVGKAGGSTIGCSLGFSLHCSEDEQSIPGLLPIITTHAFHRGVFDCKEDAAYYLFVIRDPLARVMSAFNYNRPGADKEEPKSEVFRAGTQDFYVKCPYWTLNDVAQNGLLSNGEASVECRRKARQALQGVKEFVPHWFFNFQYYYEFISQDVLRGKMLVIRNEHIVDDWNSIEGMLGGHNNVMDPSLLPANNVHNKNSTDLYLSEDSRFALCKALCNEIQVYKAILRSALNLMEEDVHISLEELRLQCPVEAASEVCDAEKPDITEKILDRKGC